MSRDVLFEYHRAVRPVRSLFYLPYSRLLTGIPILSVYQNLRRNSNKTTLNDVKIWLEYIVRRLRCQRPSSMATYIYMQFYAKLMHCNYS